MLWMHHHLCRRWCDPVACLVGAWHIWCVGVGPYCVLALPYIGQCITALLWGLTSLPTWLVWLGTCLKVCWSVPLMAVSPPSCTIDERLWFDLYQCWLSNEYNHSSVLVWCMSGVGESSDQMIEVILEVKYWVVMRTRRTLKWRTRDMSKGKPGTYNEGQEYNPVG